MQVPVPEAWRSRFIRSVMKPGNVDVQKFPGLEITNRSFLEFFLTQRLGGFIVVWFRATCEFLKVFLYIFCHIGNIASFNPALLGEP